MTARKPAKPCAECGKIARRSKALCSKCLGKTSNALPEGQWVLDIRRRIQVWQPADPTPNPTPPIVSHNTERGYQWHRVHDRHNWPLPFDDPCGCRAAHAAHEALMKATGRRARSPQRQQEAS